MADLADGGAVFLGNRCGRVMSGVAWEMQLQIGRRLEMVRWYWVADGGAVFLGHLVADC